MHVSSTWFSCAYNMLFSWLWSRDTPSVIFSQSLNRRDHDLLSVLIMSCISLLGVPYDCMWVVPFQLYVGAEITLMRSVCRIQRSLWCSFNSISFSGCILFYSQGNFSFLVSWWCDDIIVLFIESFNLFSLWQEDTDLWKWIGRTCALMVHLSCWGFRLKLTICTSEVTIVVLVIRKRGDQDGVQYSLVACCFAAFVFS